jgi:uncharacterized membrane protein (UPF0182 family)
LTLFLLVLLTVGPSLYTDFLWFRSVGLESVFLITLRAQVALFGLGSGVALAVTLANLLLARSLAGRAAALPAPVAERAPVGGLVTLALVVGAVLFALIMGAAAAVAWRTVLLFQHAQDFGLRDAVFGAPVSFYVFDLRLLRTVVGWLYGLVIGNGLAAAGVYGVYLGLRGGLGQRFHPAIRLHAAALGSLLLLLVAVSFRLGIWELVYSGRGTVPGAASYTDVNAQQPANALLSVLALLAAALVLVSGWRGSLRLAVAAVGGLIGAAILVGAIYPGLVEQFQVKPSQYLREAPYIANNIAATRQAFGLDAIRELDYPVEDSPSAADIQGNPLTISNLRLWDYRPLQDTYNQVQSIRLYYEFDDIDVDRYRVDGQLRQVMLSARELVPDRLAALAQNWVNRHLTYTHGYGAAISPVNEVAASGLPVFWLENVPPEGKFAVTRPEIYYGLRTDTYVFVNTAAQEFDYPKGDTNVYIRYAGGGGVRLDSPVTRLAYALEFGDINILLASQINADSRVLYRRTIAERLGRIAPFLLYDPDPYLVAVDGQLFWIQDAYTTSDRYPNASAHPGGFNYIRNSVKATVNAYDGAVAFYINDPNDPLVRAYAAIYPDLFRPLDQMPPALRDHLRYPEQLFSVQAEMYRTYHMRDPQVFFSREDFWGLAQEKHAQSDPTLVEPYYVIMRLPGESDAEFLLILPFTPANKDNLIAWLAARSDGERRGQLLVYKLPKDKLTYGPSQIEARIDQDPQISAQFTLWNQSGSRVIRGNLLVIPIGKSLLYVEPIFLQAETGRIPELTRVVVATGDRLSMQESLEAALTAVFGGPVAPGAGTPPVGGGGGALPPDVAALIRSANAHYQAGQDALRAGDLAKFAQELKAMEADLARLNDRAK